MNHIEALQQERGLEAIEVFGEPLPKSSDELYHDVLVEHAVGLEIAERVCKKDAGEVRLEFGHSAQRLVSDRFSYPDDSGKTLRLGLVYRQDTYFDNAASEPVEEIQVLYVRDMPDDSELHTVIGSLRHNSVSITGSDAETRTLQERLDGVMNVITSADRALSQ
jgi:hypothetical protein